MSKNTLYAILGVLAAGILGFALGRGTDFALELERPDGTRVQLDVAGEAVDHATVLDAMFRDSFLFGAATTWLAENQEMRSIRDQELADMLAQRACDSIPETPLATRLAALEQCANRPENRALRRLALTERGYPFHFVGVPVRVSIPEEEDWPERGEASVCSHDFYGRELELVHPATADPVFVEASQRIYPCSASGVGTEMHLHPADAREIFGAQLLGIDTLYVFYNEASN